MAEDEPETRDQFEARIAVARHYHDRADRGSSLYRRRPRLSPLRRMKAPALVKRWLGGGNARFHRHGPPAGDGRHDPRLEFFGAGMLASAVATGFSWISQFFYLECADRARRIWRPPFVVIHRGF